VKHLAACHTFNPLAESGGQTVKRTFTASITREGDWYVAQCLDVDIVSQGDTEEEALTNLQVALELHFTPPVATELPELRPIEVELCAAWTAA
jgi:predicted RNase H-like HicB family nuclease